MTKSIKCNTCKARVAHWSLKDGVCQGCRNPDAIVSARISGKVKWFNDAKGYGSIESNGQEYFAHYTNITGDGFKTLCDGLFVTFEPCERKGIQGLCARLITKDLTKPIEPSEVAS